MQATTQSGPDVVVQAKPKAVTVFRSDGSQQVLKIPKSPDEMEALLAQRRKISDQLTSVTERRNSITQQLKTVPDEARSGLQARLEVLDARAVQLESDLGAVGRSIAAASPDLISMAYQPLEEGGKSGGEDFAAGMAAAGVPIFLVMAGVYFFSRRRWRKQTRRNAPALPSVDSDRLQRLEHGMEAMAIEIERISEGQRFVTKLLSDAHANESTSAR
jgi:hypothetical protein